MGVSKKTRKAKRPKARKFVKPKTTAQVQLAWVVSEAKAAEYEYSWKRASALERLSAIRNFIEGFLRNFKGKKRKR